MLVYQCDKCGSTGSEVYGITSNNVTTDACEECLSEALVALAWKGDYNTVRAFTGAEVVEGNPMLIDGEPFTWDEAREYMEDIIYDNAIEDIWPDVMGTSIVRRVL